MRKLTVPRLARAGRAGGGPRSGSQSGCLREMLEFLVSAFAHFCTNHSEKGVGWQTIKQKRKDRGETGRCGERTTGPGLLEDCGAGRGACLCCGRGLQGHGTGSI